MGSFLKVSLLWCCTKSLIGSTYAQPGQKCLVSAHGLSYKRRVGQSRGADTDLCDDPAARGDIRICAASIDRSLPTQPRPPCAATIDLQMYSPRPSPSNRRVDFARKKRSNT